MDSKFIRNYASRSRLALYCLHWTLVHFFNVLARGRARDLKDLLQLVRFRTELLLYLDVLRLVLLRSTEWEAGRSREQGLHTRRLRIQRLEELRLHFTPHPLLYHDAAHRPDVNRPRVVSLHQNELRSAIPPRHDMLGQLALHRARLSVPQRGVRRLRSAQCHRSGGRAHLTRQPKVDDLHVALAVNEHVRGLEVAMDQIRTLRLITWIWTYLHVEQTTEDLVQDTLDVLIAPSRDALPRLQHLGQIPAPVLLSMKAKGGNYLHHPQLFEGLLIAGKEDVSSGNQHGIQTTSTWQYSGGDIA